MRCLVDTRLSIAGRRATGYNPAVQYRNLGASGLKVSVVSLGSWLTIGRTVDEATATRLVRASFERGVNLFDTADVYASGEAELALGRAIEGIPRHRLVLASKCFFPMSDDPNDRGLSRKHLHESVVATLRRLRTDYVDVFQCHRFDPDTPVAETAMAMDDLIRRGLVLYWGVSQWPAERIVEAAEVCRRHGLHPPIANQPLYNLFDREIEAVVLPTCERHGIGQVVYSPLAQGVLSGKYRPGAPLPHESRAADQRSNQFIGRYLTPEHLQRSRELVAIASRHACTAAQMALAFCLRDPRVASVIVGARSEVQMLDNIGAADVTLSEHALRELDQLFPV
jgi:voltage-dependent potassium channel beta subunit